MSRSIFGWSLPPGVSMRDIDPPDRPCEICGLDPGNCLCPECPTCGATGDPACYVPGVHGLLRTEEQIESRAEADEWLAMEAQADALAEAQYAVDLNDTDELVRRFYDD